MENRFGDYERVEEAKFHTAGVEEPLALETGELPESYGETRVVLLAVDPYLIHAYWEVAPGKLEEAQAQLGDDFDKARACLRLYDTAGAWFDVEIDLAAGNWYVHLWSPEKSYCADLGFRAQDGRFLALARSNQIRTPRATPQTAPEEIPVRAEEPLQQPGATELTGPGPEPAEPTLPPAEPFPDGPALGPASPAPIPEVEREQPRPAPLAETLDIIRATFASLTPFPRQQPPPETPAAAEEPAHPDVTEMTERKFTSGVSSGLLGAPKR